MEGIGIFLIVIAVLIIIGSIVCILNNPDNDFISIFCSFLCFISGILIGCGVTMITEDTIEPLDVYRGKTELKIIETKIGNDIIGKDSIVVLKK